MQAKTVIGILLVFATLPFAAAANNISTDDGEITGRALLFDLTRFDPDLAAVAGLATAKVSWFGGAVNFEKGHSGWIYASPAGTGDPSQERLTPTDVFYNFTDDNGAVWSVREWKYLLIKDVQYRLGDQTATERAGYEVPVWTVESKGKPVRDELLGLTYNFVVVVNVAKLGVTPVDEAGEPTGQTFAADPQRSGEIDLHFSRTDPVSRCLRC